MQNTPSFPRSFGVGSSGADTSDIHNLRASDSTVNSVRGNLIFDECSGNGCTIPAHIEAALDTGRTSVSFMPPAFSRGDLARSLLYMAVRYDGSETNTEKLILSDVANQTAFTMGNLTTILRWHFEDPPADMEITRNKKVCELFQHNRNPFIDFPELATKLFAPELPPASTSIPTSPHTLSPSSSDSLSPTNVESPSTDNPRDYAVIVGAAVGSIFAVGILISMTWIFCKRFKTSQKTEFQNITL